MNRKTWSTRLIFRPSPDHCGFCVSSRCTLDHEDTARRSYRPVQAFTKPLAQPFLSSLGNSVCRGNWNVLLLRNVTRCSLLLLARVSCCKGKSVPLQAWKGPEDSRKLRFPDFMTTAQDSGKIVSLTHRPPLPPGNAPGTHFCYRLSRLQGHSAIGRILCQ